MEVVINGLYINKLSIVLSEVEVNSKRRDVGDSSA